PCPGLLKSASASHHDGQHPHHLSHLITLPHSYSPPISSKRGGFVRLEGIVVRLASPSNLSGTFLASPLGKTSTPSAGVSFPLAGISSRPLDCVTGSNVQAFISRSPFCDLFTTPRMIRRTLVPFTAGLALFVVVAFHPPTLASAATEVLRP